MNPQLLPAQLDGDVPAWTQTVVAFLAEKERRSGSLRTTEGYSRMLWPFLNRIGSPDRVTPAHVLAWAHGIGASGREPSSATVGARIACLSSYYRFLIRMQIATANPCDALERPKTIPSLARGLTAEQIRQLLAVVPDTVAGRRDRALLLTFILTGRRRSEVIGLTSGDISLDGESAYYSYRGKGGKRGRRELPRPALEAICATLADAGLDLASMDHAGSLWQAGAGLRGVTSSTFYTRFRRYLRAAGLAPAGLHLLRHSAAKLRRDAGSSIEAVSSFLDHSSLAVTSVYLRRLEGEIDQTWPSRSGSDDPSGSAQNDSIETTNSDEQSVLQFIEQLRSEAAREDLPPNFRRIAEAGARALSDMLAALRSGNNDAVQEIWTGTIRPDGKKANDGLLQVLPRWARGQEVLDALAGIVVVDEAAQPLTVTVHWERVPRKLRPAAASLASELVDAYYGRPKGGRPRTKSRGAETG